LFAGSGVLGLEAVSRGAAHATLVEREHSCVTQLHLNVATLGAAARIRVVESDAIRFLAAAPAQRFDVVFLDPPYASDLAARAVPLLSANWLSPAALLYLETALAQPAITLPEGWRMMRAGETRQARYCLIQVAG
jgi:16S rRNA (guanine966-N2)-methyltransferase